VPPAAAESQSEDVRQLLAVRHATGALDPDRSHHTRQSRQQRVLYVRASHRSTFRPEAAVTLQTTGAAQTRR